MGTVKVDLTVWNKAKDSISSGYISDLCIHRISRVCLVLSCWHFRDKILGHRPYKVCWRTQSAADRHQENHPNE